jgi:uncharacterized Zn ribbon protein
MIENQICIFLFGVAITYVILQLVYRSADKGTAYGECPFCRNNVWASYETMYECPECKRRSTDVELKERSYQNDFEEEQEKQRESEKIHREWKEQEYHQKLNELRDDYKDLWRY